MQKDLQAAVYEPSILGVDGIIVWGSHTNSHYATNCSSVENYLKTIYGKFAEHVIISAHNCSAILCKSHGRCVLNETMNKLNPSFAPTHLKYTFYDPTRDSALDEYFSTVINNGITMMKQGFNTKYLTTQYTCQCFPSWKGSQCDVPA